MRFSTSFKFVKTSPQGDPDQINDSVEVKTKQVCYGSEMDEIFDGMYLFMNFYLY